MKKILLAIAALGIISSAEANNISVANVSINGQNTTTHSSLINYDITWENSWRTSTNESNYDGAWLFVKFRKKNAFAWQHATINYGATAAAAGHTQPTGSTLQTAADGKGVWIYRAANGAGTVNFTGAKLRWNYGVDGVADNDSVEIRVFAVEMVNVPQGSFVLGSNGSETYRFRRGDKDTCFAVNSEGSITVGAAATHLNSSSASTLATGTISANYPKGYNSFWVMKYEISQLQYTDFLNSLDFNMANTRDNGVVTGTHPALVAPQPERSMTFLSGVDVMCFLDWSALRPMTEFEYEKACRGANQMPVPDEYAWGNTSASNITTVTDQGLSTETWATGNCNYSNAAPMRCGALATGTSNRQTSGATFYGIMEMTGNLYEFIINANSSGRTFTNVNGDGYLDNSAAYNVTTWPTAASGTGLRGSAYNAGVNTYMCVSDRASANATSFPRGTGYGGRGVRTAE